MLDHQRQVLPLGKLCQSDDIHTIIGPDLVVVFRVGKRESEHALLLEVRLVDTRERAHDDGESAEEARFEGSVFARGAFAVVVVTCGGAR